MDICKINKKSYLCLEFVSNIGIEFVQKSCNGYG